MPNEDQARQACQALHRTEVKGCTLNVEESKPSSKGNKPLMDEHVRAQAKSQDQGMPRYRIACVCYLRTNFSILSLSSTFWLLGVTHMTKHRSTEVETAVTTRHVNQNSIINPVEWNLCIRIQNVSRLSHSTLSVNCSHIRPRCAFFHV